MKGCTGPHSSVCQLRNTMTQFAIQRLGLVTWPTCEREAELGEGKLWSLCRSTYTFGEPLSVTFSPYPCFGDQPKPSQPPEEETYTLSTFVPMKHPEKLDLIWAKVIISLNDNKVTLMTI